MRWTKHIVAAALCALGATAADATSITNRHVTGFITDGSRFIVFFDGSGFSTACSVGSRYALDPTTAYGQTNVALLLTAYSLNRLVTLAGDGSCHGGDTEFVSLIATDGH